jgi:hypothetical protein
MNTDFRLPVYVIVVALLLVAFGLGEAHAQSTETHVVKSKHANGGQPMTVPVSSSPGGVAVHAVSPSVGNGSPGPHARVISHVGNRWELEGSNGGRCIQVLDRGETLADAVRKCEEASRVLVTGRSSNGAPVLRAEARTRKAGQ